MTNEISQAFASARPIFLLGILPRCGTNFLSDLLCLHPDCASRDPIYENYNVAYAGRLLAYADRVRP